MDLFNPILLIAMPQLIDPNFERSVVLILHHDRQGAFGLIINSPTNVSLETFAESQNIAVHPSLAVQSIFRGGPVEPERGYLLHSDSTIAEKQEILPKLLISTTPETLKQFFEEGRRPLKFILGSASWGAGQLEEEMAQGAWITTRADAKYVFQTEPTDLWNTILRDMGVNPAQLATGGGGAVH